MVREIFIRIKGDTFTIKIALPVQPKPDFFIFY